ncbi:LysR substrate-binding domain-containing protein [Falsirhodobacter xinxiangensis]|uniref:LysR substrate-binding domain-containing protein n=1 Tax=Falsirhodobacter xinxiangensis TaxID=2530049 RepID=UPI0010AA1CE3|nr:LysR substrate-binding domain-containing protein [Rhodobacter xinxiangensis]
MHPAIKLRHVRTFLAIAAEGNLSAVARAQGLTQPALSRTLAELETLLGKPLFQRQGRRLTLTEAGTAFRRHAAEAVHLLEAAAAAVHPGTAPRKLRLGVLPTAARRLFPALALEFRAARPETVLTMITGAHDYLLGLLRGGGIDLMIGRMPAAADIAGLSFTHLYDEEVVIALRAGHPMASADPVQLLTRLPMILPPEGAIIRRAVDDWIALQGHGKLRPAFETVSPEIGRSLVLASDAAWLISGGVIRPEVMRAEMIARPLGAGFLSGPVGITRREDDTAGPAATLILRLARDLVPNGRKDW